MRRLKINLEGIDRSQESLSTLEMDSSQLQQAQEKARIADKAVKSCAEIISEDLANMVMTTLPMTLAEIGGETKSVNLVSKGVESYLEELARGKLVVAQVLLTYTKASQFQEMLGENLGKIADKDQLLDDKQKAANLIGNLVLVVLNQVNEKAIDFEDSMEKNLTRH